MAVQAGGHLEATDLTFTEVGAVGAEVQGEGSCLSLTDCEIYDLSKQLAEGGIEYEDERLSVHTLGMNVHSSGRAHLSSLVVRGSFGLTMGVNVKSRASATLVDCSISEVRAGLYVSESCVHATKCHFRENAEDGVEAGEGAP